MIFFFGDGRLGNQLFQYQFIRSVESEDHTIVTFSFDDIEGLFVSIPKLINIQRKHLKFLIRKVAMPLLDFLAQKKLISSYQIDTYAENGFIVPDVSYTRTKGWLPLIYIYPGYFQSEVFFRQDVVNKLIFKKIYADKADEYLALIPDNYNKVFVHVRRGDYLDFSVLGKKDVTLPAKYYDELIQWYEDNVEHPFFVFLTDDPEFVAQYFERVKNKLISNNSMFVDFVIMTLCEYGIMSNSSFSWWGGYMMKNNKKLFAPKYWLGWKSKVDYHKGIKPGFAEEVEVTE